MLAAHRASGARAQDVNLILLLPPLALLAAQGALVLRARRGGRARLVRRARLRLLRLPGVAGLLRHADRPAAARRQQLLQERARLRAASSSCCRSCSRSRCSLGWLYLMFFTDALAGAQRGALGGRHRAAVGHASPCCGCRGPTTRRATARWRCSCARRSRSTRPASRSARSASRRPRRSTTTPASGRSRSTSLKPEACPLLLVQGSPKHEFDGPGRGLGQARRRRPARRQVRALPPLPAAEAMNTTPPTDCKAWAQLQHHAESWRDVHLQRAVRQRRRAQRAVRRRGARHALRLLAPAHGRDDAAPARQPRRRARPAGMARGAALRQADQHQREARCVAHRVARRRCRPAEVLATRSSA